MNPTPFKRLLLSALCILAFQAPALAQTPAPAARSAAPASALVQIEQAWIRPSVPGQQGTGGYLRITARETLELVGASSPVAGVAEIHEMKMEGDVMRMRPLKSLALPAGKTVELKPGGLHLMLMDLKQPLTAGSAVPVTLLVKDSKGTESRIETRLLVSTVAPGGAASHPPRKH